MPELSILAVVSLLGALIVGLVTGWVLRGNRSKAEKAAVSAGWQEQLEAQRNEHERLLDQNKSLMQQNSQYQASNRDSKMRATELSEALKEAFERRDELQRQLKDIRSNLEAAVTARSELQNTLESRSIEDEATSAALKKRDDKIAHLNKELAGWQARVPPLIERFRERNEAALRLETELGDAQERIEALEAMLGSDETRVEPIDPQALGDDLDASNEAMPADDEALGPDSVVAGDEAAAWRTDTDAGNELNVERESEEAGANEPADDDGQEYGGGDDDGDGDDEIAAHDDDIEDQHAADALPADGEVDAGDNEDRDAEAVLTSGVYAWSNGEYADNLKLIKGVGPAIEKTLKEMGIRRFEQIAAMSEYDIDRIARRLKGFRSRIYREDWIGQARDLQQQKAADAP